MKNETRKQIYFWGALWNLSFTFSGLVLPRLTMWIMFGSAKAITGALARTFFALFWVAVGLFGIGYYMASRDPDKNETVIWTGCLGKVIVFSSFLSLYLRNLMKPFGVIVGLGDFIWTFFFLAALKGEKAREIAAEKGIS